MGPIGVYAYAPYATVTMACLSVNSVYNIDILWLNGWMDQGWRARWPRPRQQCLIGGHSPTQLPPSGSGTAVGEGEFLELLLLAI